MRIRSGSLAHWDAHHVVILLPLLLLLLGSSSWGQMQPDHNNSAGLQALLAQHYFPCNCFFFSPSL